MTRAITSDELALLRSEGQWSKLYMAVLKPNTVYTARLATVPASNDMVYRVPYNTGSGTLSDVKPGMTMLVGSSAGDRDLGVARIRIAPDGSYFYIGETSEIRFQSGAWLTITDDFDLWARHVHVDDDGTLLMDVNIGYSDQHGYFDPVPVLGTHAVLWKTGATVSVNFNSSDSWVFDSTITGHAWSAPGSSSSSGMTTATPTITYNAAGIYRVLCTVTAANTKTAMGARYVFVFDDDHPPSTVFQLANLEGSVDAGGWMFDVTMQAEASLSDLREGTLVILFAKDYFNGVEQSIGPITGRENIVCVGRVGPSESVRWDPIAGQVHFNVQGPHFWLNKIKVSACQLEFSGSAPTEWGKVYGLTVDKALWHLLHWRSTATIVMDFYRTGDTRYNDKAASLANFIWTQLNEFAGQKIFAHVLCDRFGRLFAEIDPQMVPEASRSSFPTVMTVTTEDWSDVSEFERATHPDTGQVNLSAKVITSAGASTTVYSLAPGHIPRRFGDMEPPIDGLLAGGQSQSNQMAGLYLGWKINPFPNIPLKLAENNRFMDICPHQFLDITIEEDDTPRGVSYDGNIIPRRVRFPYDAEARWLSVDVTCEGENTEALSANGDIPNDTTVDVSIPPLPPLPPLPDIPVIIPGIPEPSADGPSSVIVHDTTLGFIYTTNFSDASPTWLTMNAGLTSTQYQNANFVLVCLNGVLYAGLTGSSTNIFIARCPGVGQAWTVVETWATIHARYPAYSNANLLRPAVNHLVAESIAFVAGAVEQNHIYVGSAGTYTQGAQIIATDVGGNPKPLSISLGGTLSYGFGKWRLTGEFQWSLFALAAHYWLFSPAGALSSRADLPNDAGVLGDAVWGSASATIYLARNSGGLYRFENNFQDPVVTWINEPIGPLAWMACDNTGFLLMGRWGGKGFSPDKGTTWAALPNLPPSTWDFLWAGPGEDAASSRWIAFATSDIEYTNDFGNTWDIRIGNMPSINPVSHINAYAIVGY